MSGVVLLLLVLLSGSAGKLPLPLSVGSTIIVLSPPPPVLSGDKLEGLELPEVPPGAGAAGVAAGAEAVALVVGESPDEAVAVALPLLEVAPGVYTVWLLLLDSPVGEVAVALLVLPAPLPEVDELDLAKLLLPPEASLGVEI